MFELNVRPALALVDCGNCLPRHPELRRNLLLRQPFRNHFSNSQNIRFNQFGLVMLRTSWQAFGMSPRAMTISAGQESHSLRVFVVFPVSQVFKIFRRIVQFIAVNVVDCISVRAGADKRHCDNLMNEPPLRASIEKCKTKVSIMVNMWLQAASGGMSSHRSAVAANLPSIGYAVNAFVSWNLSPFFLVSGIVKVSHWIRASFARMLMIMAVDVRQDISGQLFRESVPHA